ncbi:MAG: hypothetical protein HY326_01800 [Chloroflexi bacterium]|nr:hypothetical protein [Chloroflexota bacterium]
MIPIDFHDLVARILTVLIPAAPYLKKAAEGAAGKLGQDAWQKARDLAAKVRDRFHKDQNKKAEQSLDLFLEDPGTFESALSKLLLETLEKHPEWAREIREQLAQPALQEIIDQGHSDFARIKQTLSGSGTQRIVGKGSKFRDIEQKKE